MLSILSGGYYDAAYDADSIEARVEGLFARASSIILADIAIDFESLEEDFEVYPPQIPDLSLEGPLVLSGRYSGEFPENLEARGILADMSNFSVHLKVQEAKEMPLSKVLAKQQIEILTAEAWFTKNKKLEEKIARMSVQHGIVSEYTNMALIEIEKTKETTEPSKVQKKTEDPKLQKAIMLRNLGLGFGDLTATAENTPPGSTSKPEAAEMFVQAASNCCRMLCDKCCCMCCIQMCSKINDQCAVVMTQILGSLACLGCLACCELCCSKQQG
nr:inter alpha-trypsin inhibitor, heavy chain 4-like [Ipomoea batatas]